MPPVTDADLPVTFRPQRTRLLLYGAGLTLFAVLTAVGFALRLGPGERASFVCTGLLFLGVLLLLSRPSVVADAEGVTVTNLTRTRRLAWAEILRVNLRPGDPWVYLDLADGTSLPAMGIQPGVDRRRAVADAEALRALAARHGSAAPGS